MIPLKSDLIPGEYITQNGETFMLIERAPSWRPDDTPFCVGNISSDRQITHATQRWKVDIGGFITHRYVEYFHGQGHVSANCPAWTRLENDNN
jgi:hypothetical protein